MPQISVSVRRPRIADETSQAESRRSAGLSGWCGLVETNPVGSRVDELHLFAVPRTWLDAWIEEWIPAIAEFCVQRFDVAHHDEHSGPRRSIVVM
jgi:hypothetical protein